MAKKPPKLFLKPLSPADFEKKVLKRIYIREYRDFLGRALVKDQTGKLIVAGNLSKKDLKKLAKIATSVRKNTGFVQKGKLILAVALLGAIVIFAVIFKDMLVETAAEAGLEAVFGARADIQGLQFQILGGRIAFDHLEVANSEKPLSNLFELGATEIKINVIELIKGNVILDNSMCQEIRWDTPRAFSGALPGREKPKEEVKKEEEQKNEDPFAILNLATDAAADILSREKEKLASVVLLDELAAQYPSLTDKWKKNAVASAKKIDSFAATAKTVSEIRIENLKTLEDTAKALGAIDTAYREYTALEKDIKTTYEEFEQDLARVKADQSQVRETINRDLDYLSSIVTSPVSGATSFAAALLDRFLRQYVGDIYGYAMQALFYKELLKPSSEQQLKEQPPEQRYGYYVQFPGNVYPKFWLRNMEFSLGSLDADYIKGKLSDATSDPDLAGQATALAYEQKTGGQLIKVNGSMDGRSNSNTLAEAAIGLSGYPFSLDTGLEFLNIKSFKATAKLTLGFALDRNQRTGGAVEIELADPVFAKGDTPNLLTDKAYAALSSLSFIRIKARYSPRPDGALDFSIESNLEAILNQILAGLVNDLAAQAKARLKAEFDKLIKDRLGAYNGLAADFIDLDKMFAGDFSRLADYTKLLDGKKQQVTKSTNKAGEELEKLKKQFGF